MVICRLCAKEFKRITNTHLWKEHRITMEEYMSHFPNAPIDSPGLAESRVAHFRGKTYEEIYGENKAASLVNVRRKDALKQMQDEDQITVRKEKCGKHERTPEIRTKQSWAKMTHGGDNYRRRALDYYGLECARCGLTTEDEQDFVVHHNDFRNFRSDLADHSLENLTVLCKSCHPKLHNELDKTVAGFTGLNEIEKGVHYIFKGLKTSLGLNLKDSNFKDTPKRVARAYAEIFSGVKDTDKQIEEVLATSFPNEGYDGLIFSSKIVTYSMCPHHLLPVIYTIFVGYMPSEDGRILGISKLARVAEILSARPVLQEVLTKDIVRALETVKPKGVGVYVRGIHYCMRMRGIKAQHAGITTSDLTGKFLESDHLWKEFYDMISLSLKEGGTV